MGQQCPLLAHAGRARSSNIWSLFVYVNLIFLGADREPGSPAPCLANDPLFSVAEEGDRGGKVLAPASALPRFRKYTIEDFNLLNLLGKGSFGKVWTLPLV